MEIDIIINNLKEMLQDRGDNIDEFNEHEVVIDREEFYNDKNVLEFHTSNTTIIFALTKKLRRNILEELKEYAGNDIMDFVGKYNNKLNVILVMNNDTVSTPIAVQLNKYDKMLQKKGGTLQFFHVKNLLFNPTRHQLVPKHRKLSAEEITEVMDKYLIKSKVQMPYILHNDAIAKWLGLKQGDVVQIERYNENSGLSYYYRVCI
jgi:DNA-directed RNA polymerase I, II, and III subunit RPABC1